MINKLNRYLILTQRIAMLESVRNNCSHNFSKMSYDPFISSTSEIIPRWSKQCKKCGKKEYSFEENKVSHLTKKLSL